ncbi:MAG: hypothetical protein OXC26_17485 [Albidovulum sp.]|nr:hypothetical protein [Albidovulum sp.]
MIRLVIADTWWPDRAGRQHFSLIPNRLDVEALVCNEHCSVVQKTALGDHFRYPFLRVAPHDTQAAESFISRFLKKCSNLLARLPLFPGDR